MRENDFYKGAGEIATLRVLHAGGGEVHDIEVPTDTPAADLHQALLTGGHHEAGPTTENAEENTERFRDAAHASWIASGSGTKRAEAGFIDPGSRSQYPTQEDPSYGSHLVQQVPGSAFGALHTHPNESGGRPSQQDIDIAKKLVKPIWVVSKDGLSMVRPSDGAVIKVFDGTNWMEKKK
jgi:hypothetical protein